VGNLRLTLSGTYTVGVVDDGLNEVFDYLITFNLAKCGTNQREAGDGPESLAPGQLSYGHIEPADYDTFCFDAASNDVIYLTVLRTNGPGTSPYLYLYDPTGAVVTEGSANSILTYVPNRRLTLSGTYTVAVIDDGLNESFDYTICMVKAPGPNFPDQGDGPYELVPFQPVFAQIVPGDLDAFAFRAIAGDTIALKVQKVSGAGQNPVLELHAPDGTLLATGSSSSSATVGVSCAPQTGTYVAFVYDNGLNESFSYSITLNQSPIVPPSGGNTQYLAAYLCNTNVFLRWETNSAGFGLERTPTLPATNWVPVLEAPYVIADHYYLALGFPTNRSAFYRLHCTNCPPGP
jgi:hypothetical protein